MRRPIKVWGAELDNGNRITTADEGVVGVTIHPDKSVTYVNPQGQTIDVEGSWTSYNPRFN